IGYYKTLLGVAMARCGPMPITPDVPASRVRKMLETVAPKLVLTVDDPDSAVLEVISKSDVRTVGRILAATRDPAAPDLHVIREQIDSVPADPCFVLFTSGSTGIPKVVRGTNASLANLVEFEVDRCGSEYVAMTGQYAPIGFDVAFQEIYSTFVSGGVLCPFPLEIRSEPEKVGAFIERRGITRTFLPPLMLRAVAAVREEGFPNCLREVLCIGEQLRIDDAVRRAAGARGTLRIVNQYGPAEAPQVTSLDLGEDVLEWDDRPTIGAPIRNVRIRIVDEDGRAVPMGSSGEVMIGGVAVGLGYANDPMNSSFTEEDGVRWYQTGDLGRILPSGEIEFIGRVDDQVKVAGHRVEPLEVEQAIGRLPEVAEVGVVSWSVDDVVRLAAYVEAEVDGDAIRRRLAGVLPPWLVPTAIVVVDAIPRNPNGKVDRAALRIRAERSEAAEEIPSSTPDENLASTLRAFGLPVAMRLRSDAPLVEQGLDSLGAIRMQLKLRENGYTGIDIGAILRSSPKVLVELLGVVGDTRRLRPRAPEPSPRREDKAAVQGSDDWESLDPLSRDLIYQAAISPAGSYHLAWRVEIPSQRTLEYVRERVAGISREWPTLRTARDPEKGCRLLPSDMADAGMMEAFESQPSRREIDHLLRHPFDLQRGDCFRAATWMEPGRRVVLLVFHHVAVDGRAAGSIIDSAFGSRNAATENLQTNPTFPSSLSKAEDWWVKRLADDLKGDPLPQRSEDANDESILFTAIESEGRGFDRCLEASIKNSGSPIALAVLAWGLILGRRLGKDRTVIGLPFASESTSAELGVSLLPIVVPIGDDVTIIEALESTSSVILGGIENRQASLGSLIRRLEPGKQHLHPPFDGVFTQDDLRRESGEARILWEPVGRGPFQATIVVPGLESLESPFGLEIDEWTLDGEHADSFVDRYFEILRQLVESLDDGRGTQLLGSIDSLGEASQVKIRSFERSDAFEEGSSSVAEVFEATVARNPGAVAIVDGERSITYGELDSWSRAIASELLRAGIEHGEAVALTGTRSASTIAGMLGVTRAGGFFVPLDSDSPEARIRAQMASIRPRFGVGPKISKVLTGNVKKWIDLETSRVSTMDASLPALGLETPLYAMFTSGTTGEPRGTLVPHRAVLRLAQDPWFLPRSHHFKMLHAAPIAFDASTLEIWWPLLNGLTVVCWDGKGSDLEGIGALVRRERIDGCWLTAALFHTAVDQMPYIFESMSVVLTGGDVVSAAHASRIGRRYPDLVLINGYGPTENTVFTTCDLIEVDRDRIDKPISIGRPIRGTRVRILDERGKRVPVGRFGELVTDGAGLAIGYLDPVSNVCLSGGFEGGTSKGTLYRTGDRARWLQDGRIEFNGRIDHQVKVNGHRVELSAVDSAIRRIPEVEDAAAMLLESSTGSKSIGAVIVQNASGRIDRESVRRRLAMVIPTWEIPTEIMFVDRIPSTPNGKVDRKSCVRLILESRSKPRSIGRVGEETTDEIDVILRRAVEEISGRRLNSRSMTLSEVGIDSIELLRLSIRLENLFSRPVHLESLVATASLSEIAAVIRDDIQLESKEIVELRPPEAHTNRSVFCVPGVGGTVFSFLALLDGIPTSIPVNGLPYRGIGGSRPPLRSIEEMA
ncbi:MAG: AMP-binding protein, partial [Phycisphaera sp.]|nr:AMP-binding protein [Phycisphaera sp.]